MPTSGTTSSLATARDIIKDALIELQVISAKETPAAEDAELGLRRLNWMLKETEADGTSLWRFKYDGTATVTAGTAEFTPDPPMLDVSEARVVIAANERPLQRMEWGQFVSYPNKSASGTPLIFVPKVGLDALSLQLWRVPDTDVTINYSGGRLIEDVTDLNQTLDVPRQYTNTVMMNLAARLAPAFGLAGDANAIVTIREAARLYQIMRAADRPASYFFERA